MNVAMLTSVSHGTPWAPLTTPNHAEYCQRHGYTFIARHLPYDAAVADFDFLLSLIGHFDVVWCLDSDAVVTNMTMRVEDVPLRAGMNVCEEGLDPNGPIINCGSVMWTASNESRAVLFTLKGNEEEWRGMKWIWQEWLSVGRGHALVGQHITVHPVGRFGSCHHGDVNRWSPGAYAYHPCGMGHVERLHVIRGILGQVVR